MKRESAAVIAPGEEWQHPDEPLFDELPELARGCVDPWWEDGKARTPWSLKLNFTADSVQVIVTDEAARRSSYTHGRTVQEALLAIERLLTAGGLPWRPWGRK